MKQSVTDVAGKLIHSKYEKPWGSGNPVRSPGNSDFRHGLIVDTNFHIIKKLPGGGVVEHPGAWRLVYQPKSQGSGFWFDLHFGDKAICLNEMVNPAWPIYPVTSGSHIFVDGHGSENGSNRQFITEIHLDVEEFKASKAGILSAFHELGHAIIYETILKAAKENDGFLMKKLAQAFFPKTRFSAPIFPELAPGSFGKEITDAVRFFEGWLYQNKIEYKWVHPRLHERGAWAYAIKAAKKIGLLNEFNGTDAPTHYRPLLESYGDAVLEKAGAIAGRHSN